MKCSSPSIALPYDMQYISSDATTTKDYTHYSIVARSTHQVRTNTNKSTFISHAHLNNELEKLREVISTHINDITGYSSDDMDIDIKTTFMLPLLSVSTSDLMFIEKYFNDGFRCKNRVILKQLYGSVIYGSANDNLPRANIYVGYDINVYLSSKYINYLKVKEPKLSLNSGHNVLIHTISLTSSP